MGKDVKFWVGLNLKDDAAIWWNLLKGDKMKALLYE